MVGLSRFAVPLLGFALAGCGDKQNPAGDFHEVSYGQTIAPMMARSCSMAGCHGGPTPIMGIGLDTYDGVKANAVSANQAIQEGSMPIAPGESLTDTDKADFQAWVGAGAPNN